MTMQPGVSTELPTEFGIFSVRAYPYEVESMPNLALATPELDVSQPVYVRIHSECMTGDVFSSTKCDCGEQLKFAMNWVQQHGGVIIYLRQEGRGIGLVNKLKAYNLQAIGYDTREANLELGFHEDSRDYTPAIEILEDLGIRQIKLLTNNPEKLGAFEGTDIQVVDRVPVEIKPKPENIGYLKTKKNDMGHLLSSDQL
jgi:3,4-dihydroxy 2-butanone 4-phosphate synthase/GTP cyclohydrolase II